MDMPLTVQEKYTHQSNIIVFISIMATCGYQSAAANPQDAQRLRKGWAQVDVPGAVCGDGGPYSILLRRGLPEKVVVELSGGGACWNQTTCFGPVPLAKMHLERPGEPQGLASDQASQSPFFNATYVYLPYCTGDVHGGNHIANYGPRVAHHVGGSNVASVTLVLGAALDLFGHAEEFFLVGRSAGAIGSILHLQHFDALLGPATRRIAIIDSPGLHFGERFWDRFSFSYFDDVRERMSAVGIELDQDNGMIATHMPSLCRRYSNWKIGYLQSTRDIVMSLVFGAVSQAHHEALVMGSMGFSQLAREQAGDCAVWIQSSPVHTFTGSGQGLREQSNGVAARAFIDSLVADGPAGSILPETRK